MSFVRFTPNPRRVQGIGPALYGETLQMHGVRSLVLYLRVLGFEGIDSPVFWLALETSDTPKGDFVSLGRFEAIGGSGGATTRRFDDPMRFVRWNVVQLDGATAALFTLEGVAAG